MDHFAGLDVSVKDTSVCIVDGAGKIIREVKVASEPDALLAVLNNLSERDRPGAISRCMKRAIVALARRLAVIMHRIWVDGTEFCWTADTNRFAIPHCTVVVRQREKQT